MIAGELQPSYADRSAIRPGCALTFHDTTLEALADDMSFAVTQRSTSCDRGDVGSVASSIDGGTLIGKVGSRQIRM
jgi:hypothetical protein